MDYTFKHEIFKLLMVIFLSKHLFFCIQVAELWWVMVFATRSLEPRVHIHLTLGFTLPLLCELSARGVANYRIEAEDYFIL